MIKTTSIDYRRKFSSASSNTMATNIVRYLYFNLIVIVYVTILFVFRQLNLAITSHFPYKISSWYKIKYHFRAQNSSQNEN